MKSVHCHLSPVTSLLLVGCGNMGGALLERWKQSSAASRIDIIDPTHRQKNESAICWHANLESLPVDYAPQVIILAVKPQQLAEILPSYKIRFGSAPLYISIAAGKTLAFYKQHLGEHAHVVRAMPNTPALIAQGMSVLCASATLPASARKIATDLLQAVGKVEWIEDEAQMDAVTAISGCGPAYVFLFLESLVAAAVQAGLSEPLARTLALQTISGSTALAAQSGKNFQHLRVDVASPGGATEAALAVLMQGDAMKALIGEAVMAAEKRSHTLSATAEPH